MKKWVRELTKEGVQIDREELQEESKGLIDLSTDI
jgi:hypothetical protein